MSKAVKSYQDLDVWMKGMALVKDTYQATVQFPNDEKFGLVNQMRRAAVSIPSNIAEGHARSGAREFTHFISITLGSVAELETQVILSVDLGYLDDATSDNLLQLLDVLGKMLQGLKKALMARRQ